MNFKSAISAMILTIGLSISFGAFAHPCDDAAAVYNESGYSCNYSSTMAIGVYNCSGGGASFVLYENGENTCGAKPAYVRFVEDPILNIKKPVVFYGNIPNLGSNKIIRPGRPSRPLNRLYQR